MESEEKNLFKFNFRKQNNSLLKFNDFSGEKAFIINSDIILKEKSFLESSDDKSNQILNIKFYSSLQDIKAIQNDNLEFILVKEEFLKSLNIEEKIYKNNYVIYFDLNEKKLIFFPKEQNILEITKNSNFSQEADIDIKMDNTKNDEGKNLSLINDKDSIEEKKKFLKFLILIYFEKKYFLRLIQSPIENEKCFSEFYLINKNFIKILKDENLENKIYNIFNSFKIDFTCHLKLEEIEKMMDNSFPDLINEVKLLSPEVKKNLFKESNFYSIQNYPDSKVSTFDSLSYPFEFILASENLFDLLYKEIKVFNSSNKNEYKFKTIIGDNVLFIQNKKIDTVFYAYILRKNDYQISHIFKYYNKNIIFQEVTNYIKDKGFNNYLCEINADNSDTKLYNQNEEIIGEYFNIDKISKNSFERMKIQNSIKQNEKLFSKYNNLNFTIKNISNNYTDLTYFINNIINKINIQNIFPVIIILKEDLEKLKESLYIKEIEELAPLKNNQEQYNKKESDIITKLLNSKYYKNPKELVKNIAYITPKEIEKDKSFHNEYVFMFKDFLELINHSEQYKKKLESLSECHYFINNNEKYIFYPKEQKLYKLNDCNNNTFKLKEVELYLDFKEIMNYLKMLNNNEKKICQNFGNNLNKIYFEEFYLVNKLWMKEFKQFYEYEKFIKSNGENYILGTTKLPENLKGAININCQLDKNIYKEVNVPINFELINKTTFNQILDYINKKNHIQLKLNYYLKTGLGDNKAFIQDNSITNIFFVYSFYMGEYILDYIIKCDKYNIDNFFFLSEKKQNFEEFISSYNIDLTKPSEQYILDENLEKIGEIKIINSKQINRPSTFINHCLGLENIGATCYMNATLQCLSNVSNVKDYFLNRHLVYCDTFNNECKLTKEFYKVINNLWKKPTGYKNYYTPTDFKNCISLMNPLFKGIAANDSKDLIIFIFETIHNEINRIIKYQTNDNIRNPDLLLFRNNYYSNNSSFLIKTFYFEQQSEIGCLSCKYNKISFNISNIIIFPLEKIREYKIRKCPEGFLSVTLDNCFDNYQEYEALTGVNQIWCNGCNKMSNAMTGNKIYTCPEVMTIILNRGKGLQFDVNFEYPDLFNIEKYIVDKTCTKNYNYELICVLTHLGPSGMSGHFIAFCKSPVNKKWYCYNDAEVSECLDPRQYKNGEIEAIPYVLFYQKIKHNIGNKITLYINYYSKQFYIDIEENKKISELINIINNKYKINNISLLLLNENDNTLLEPNQTINYYHLKDKQQITALDNY